MNATLDMLQTRWEAFAIRERAMVLAALLAVLFAMVDSALLRPMDEEHDRLEGGLTQIAGETEALNQRSRTLAEQIAGDDGGTLQREETAIRNQIRSLDHRIDQHLASMIPPGEVTKMLEALLAEESELALVQLSTLETPDAAVARRTVSNNATNSSEVAARERKPEFFRHGFRLELEGSYLATLHYLEAIESLSWDLSWDRIVYEVDEYPHAHITIELHTLSDDEDWIGV